MIPHDSILFLNNIFLKEFPMIPGSIKMLSQSYNNKYIRFSRMSTYLLSRQIYIFYCSAPCVFLIILIILCILICAFDISSNDRVLKTNVVIKYLILNKIYNIATLEYYN